MTITAFPRCEHTPEDAAILARTDANWWIRVEDRCESYYMYDVMTSPLATIRAHHIHLATRGVHGADWHALAADIVRGAA